jgi:Uncharacterised protein family UPF0640
MYSRTLSKLLNAWPGKKRFGIYRFMPAFFALGALLEYAMINWQVGTTNFCEYTELVTGIVDDLLYTKHMPVHLSMVSVPHESLC